MGFVDSHCHLTERGIIELVEEVIRDARNENVELMISCGTNKKTSKNAIDLSERFPEIWATVGLHPEEVFGARTAQREVDELRQYLSNQKVIAIGEIGLDWWWIEKSFNEDVNPEKSRDENRNIQKEVFKQQLDLATLYELPVIIHNREVNEDVITILKEHGDVRGVMHCFSQDENFLKEVLGLGFYVSFAGNMTFKKNEELRKVLKMVPLDRLLLETDSPYLTPEPRRGEWPNTPANVKLVYQRAATELGIETRELEEIVKRNVIKLFTKIT
jgi:TatD DNase family protein